MVKNSPVNAGAAADMGSIPGSGRSPGEVNGNPLQCSCLKNSMDRGAWRAIFHGAAKSWIRLSDQTSWRGTSTCSLESIMGLWFRGSKSSGFKALQRTFSAARCLQGHLAHGPLFTDKKIWDPERGSHLPKLTYQNWFSSFPGRGFL